MLHSLNELVRDVPLNVRVLVQLRDGGSLRLTRRRNADVNARRSRRVVVFMFASRLEQPRLRRALSARSQHAAEILARL